MDDIALEALRRERRHHPGHRNYRPHLTPGSPFGGNLKGLRGEQEFAREFGLEVDLHARPEGDGHRDLVLNLMRNDGSTEIFSVDVKAAVIPKDLIAEVGTVAPRTIYVLARYLESEDKCVLLGWQWGSVLLKSDPKDYGYGVLSYWTPRASLRSIAELHDRRV